MLLFGKSSDLLDETAAQEIGDLKFFYYYYLLVSYSNLSCIGYFGRFLNSSYVISRIRFDTVSLWTLISACWFVFGLWLTVLLNHIKNEDLCIL